MAPIRYSLHYEDYSEHLLSRFGKLLQIQSLVDMTLMCSSHTLRVHKAVLAASSAYFQDVLQKQTGEPLIILKMRFSVLKSLVEFMYCGKTQCLEENLDELVSAAQFLKIKGLSKVTKEGLGIANNSELPVFTPPVVVNRPPQSLINSQLPELKEPQPLPPPPELPDATAGDPADALARNTKKDMVVCYPFNMDSKGAPPAPPVVAYADTPRPVKPRRGRPSQRNTWESGAGLGRAAERALMRREQDSRKAIHQLKHLQTRYNQDYMDRVSLSQAVNSICGPESADSNYMNIDADFMYLDQSVSSNVLNPPLPYSKELNLGNQTITSSYTTPSTSGGDAGATGGVSSAMSQYVNALKNAGLPTDLPILFESGDGSYINVNEKVLLDMVQSSEIQYEVIEQPNIIQSVADPSEIKSIDDLSKSIERGEMMISNKNYDSGNSSYNKDTSGYRSQDDTISSLNAILPDNLEPFEEQQSYVVMDQRLQGTSSVMDHVNNDFSCIDGDMHFFTKSMSDDVKKYYEGHHGLDEASVMEQLCPTSTSLDTSFSMSLLDKSHLESGNLGQQFGSLNAEDLRRNDDCYDFALDCLISTPKRNDKGKYDSNQMEKDARERDEIIKDLMNIENMTQSCVENRTNNTEINKTGGIEHDKEEGFNEPLNVDSLFDAGSHETNIPEKNDSENLSAAVPSSGIQWDNTDKNKDSMAEVFEDTDIINVTSNKDLPGPDPMITPSQYDNDGPPPVIDLTKSMKSEIWNVDVDMLDDKENFEKGANAENIESTLEDDIPFAVGLQPLKQIEPTGDNSLLKRRNPLEDLTNNDDSKYLKRKMKHKKIL
ncbi:unnamed protein product [Plutella xylostella]|uniref:(diamondback moth) hypothetical protein n=1 Tax=Plutella xylostella TaxID=51655 RepID=A0A8S4FV32_PLUXY|nr:unnamed protein product [Plutella xylostella]